MTSVGLSEIAPDELSCPGVLLEAFLCFLEVAVMDVPSTVVYNFTECCVQHFVVEDEGDNVFGYERVVQPAIDRDGIVRWVVVSQRSATLPHTPPQFINLEGPFEILLVELFEEVSEVEDISHG